MTWDADDQLNTWWPWAQDVVTWWLLNALRFWVKIDMNCSCSHPFFSSVCTCIYIYIHIHVYLLYMFIYTCLLCIFIFMYIYIYMCVYHAFIKKWWRHGIMGNGPTKNGTGDPKAHGPLSDIGWCTTAFIRYNYSILFHLVQLPSPKATVGPWK